MSATPPTPAPIPAFAPAERPPELDDEFVPSDVEADVDVEVGDPGEVTGRVAGELTVEPGSLNPKSVSSSIAMTEYQLTSTVEKLASTIGASYMAWNDHL